MTRCKATTKDGTRCKANALSGKNFCLFHQGKAKSVRTLRREIHGSKRRKY